MPSQEEKGFWRTLRKQGRSLKNITRPAVPAVFRGTVNRIGAFMLTDGLGPEPRGHRILEIPALNAPVIAANDELQDQQTKEIFKVVQIGLDCPAYSLKYQLEQLTTLDQ